MTTELTQPTLSAGQILRQAREQQNLTVADVAQQLNLSKGLIDDLELDQVDAKLSSTFVRGYLRSYAKLLKIPAQHILDAYSSNSKGLHQVPSLTRSFSKRTAKEATENRFMWVTYFVIAVFVVLLVLGFWQSRFGGSASGSALPMAQTEETMLASEEARPVEAKQYQAVEPTQTENSIPVTQLKQSTSASDRPTLPVAPQPSLTTDIPAVLPAQQDVVTTATAPQTATELNSSTTSAENSAVVTTPVRKEQQAQSSGPVVTTSVQVDPQPSAAFTNDIPVVATNTAEQPVTTTATETAVAADTSTNAAINLSLNAECWVDIVDATGKRLVFGSRQAGEQLNLRGVAPVKVLLGNAAAATLSFNGEAVDLSGYPTGRVARLTLGQN